MKKVVLLLMVVTGYCGFAQFQLPITLDTVSIDTKIRIPKKNSGKITTVITSEMLEKMQGSSVADVINSVAGIEINGNLSNDGQNLIYLVRGGGNRQVVIMVDGVQLNDPSGIANDFDLRLLPASDIASIEIMKGASSVLYGSGAGAAVISIQTKKESQKPISATFSSVIGTNRASEDSAYNIAQFENTIGVDGTLGKFFYDVDFSNRYTDGISAVAAPEGAPLLDSDVFNRFNTRINLGYRFNDDIQISRFFAIDKFKSEFDNFDFTDAENLTTSEQLRTGGQFRWKYNKGNIVINDSYSWIERDIESSFPAQFDARSYTFDAYADHKLTTDINVVLGVNGNFSNFESYNIPFGGTDFEQVVSSDVANFNIIDPYLNLVYLSDFGVNLNAGVRLNNHNVYGSTFVYNLNPSYVFETGDTDIKVLGSYSTAYITPSLFQLYDPQFGNEELEPEDNRTIEGGIAVSNSKSFSFSVLYFNRSEQNFVDFVNVDPENFVFQYRNIAEDFEASGIEVEARVTAVENLTITANYTNTQADERFVVRVPEHKANASVIYTLKEKTSFGLAYQYVGDRTDLFFDPATFESSEVMLEAFNIFTFSINSRLSDRLSVFAEVFNLLDEEYEELVGFQTRGRNARIGFTLSF